MQFVFHNYSGACDEDAGSAAVDYLSAYFKDQYDKDMSALVGMYCSKSRYT